MSHRACQHAQDTQICQVEPEQERILAEMLDTECNVQYGSDILLLNLCLKDVIQKLIGNEKRQTIVNVVFVWPLDVLAAHWLLARTKV